MFTTDFDVEFAWEVRKQGNVLLRFDKERYDGWYTGFWIEHGGKEYMLRMRNGEIITFERVMEE